MKKPAFALLIICAMILTTPICAGSETIGHINNFDGKNMHIIGEAITDGAPEDVIINIANAPVYDLITGFLVDAKSIRHCGTGDGKHHACLYRRAF